MNFLTQALIYLAAAVICVPLAKRLGMGSVLGYLLAGMLIGPFVLGFIGKEGQDIMHFAEFGVVMMLFLIGLELEPSQFWKMRKSILGMGSIQLVFTSLFIFVTDDGYWTVMAGIAGCCSRLCNVLHRYCASDNKGERTFTISIRPGIIFSTAFSGYNGDSGSGNSSAYCSQRTDRKPAYRFIADRQFAGMDAGLIFFWSCRS